MEKLDAKIKRLRKEKLDIPEIAEKLGICENTVRYHLSEKVREDTKKRARKRFQKMSLKERKAISKKNYPYTKEYIKRRYHEDEEFRKRYILLVEKSVKRLRNLREKKGMCIKCGKRKAKIDRKSCVQCLRKDRDRTKKYNLKKSGSLSN
jgi:predicted ArsR family transcriptional regulator